MTDLVAELAEALGRAPAQPAEHDLGSGINARAYWSFGEHLEVVVAESERLPSETQATNAWKKRLNRRPVPLVLLVADGDAEAAVLVGPGGDPPPAFRLDPQLVLADLKEASELDALEVRRRLPIAWQRIRGAGGLTGLRNVGLFSTHYLKARVPRLPEWPELGNIGANARGRRDLRARLDALGLEAEEQASGIFLVRTHGRPAAAVLSYPAGQDFDRAAAGGELPVAGLLREMDRTGTAWGILVSGDVWRLYSADHPSRATSFVEIDLARLGDAAYFAALFSARALEANGVAATIATGSRDFAVGLGDRLRERIYGSVVPRIVESVAAELERLGEPPQTREALEGVYAATLTLLYRLLFVLYAESREYLPVLASAGYLEHSLRKRIDSVIATVESGREFDPQATDIWSDLQETFSAVANGHTEWGVPPYNGGLFHDDGRKPGGRVLARITPTNSGLGRALYDLAVDSDEVDAGRIDYSDLDIRHLGDIYEGLLQFEVDRAREPLKYDAQSDAYAAVPDGQDPDVADGAVYLRSRSGGRKASGSFYTPQIVVRHVVNEALVPAHDRHLDEVAALLDRGDDEGAARLLWNFRVCDPAMGSGHFLVDALDVLTDRVATFLSERPIAPVRAVLGQLRETVQAQARDLPPGVLEEIRDVDLLKRVVLKRSIYGVDLNPMAVELAKLALWLDAFVPGLPLSYLDHNLRRGNSLVGVVGDEVTDALQEGQTTLEESFIVTQLAEARDRAREAVEKVEYRIQDVKASEEAELKRIAAGALVKSVFDRWTAESFDLPGARGRIGQMDTLEAENDRREAEKLAEEFSFFHWPLEFPEVFGRSRPGFDVVVANPPWEKLMKEKHAIYALFRPGLRALSNPRDREALMAAMDEEGVGAAEAYAIAVAQYERLRPYFAQGGGNYELGGGGHIDLFKAFAERFLQICRQLGVVGAVLPRSILHAPSTALLRRAFLTAQTLLAADVIENTGGWVFPDVHAEQTFAVYALQRSGPGAESVVPVSPLIRNVRDLKAASDHRLPWSLELLGELLGDYEVPLLDDIESARLVRTMFDHPALGSTDQPWFARPVIEFVIARDWGNTSERLLNTEGDGIPVWTGRNFDRYAIRDDELPPYWVDDEVAHTKLLERRERSHLWRALSNDI